VEANRKMKVTIGKYPKNPLDERKVNVRIDKDDIWEMDNTLAHIIVPALKAIKESKHGSPNVDDADVPEYLRATSSQPRKNKWDTDDNWHARWDWVLDEMLWAFEQHLADWETQYYSGEHDVHFIDGVMTIGENDTFKIDIDGLKAHEYRMIHGTTLFGKYYASLWT
jgi:hypothetical protein